jgi:hypothetical protein
MKKIAIVQSNYIPWKGYFDLINMVDEFILLDEVDYTVRDWRNRNKIKTANGLLWLTIPVHKKHAVRQKINETRVSRTEWPLKHWETIRRNYAKAAAFREYAPQLEQIYREVSTDMLSEINCHFLTKLCAMLGITTPITKSKDYGVVEGKTMRLVDLCRKSGADVYLTGPSAADYMDESAFRQAGIEIEWMNYSGYPEYRQLHGDFSHGVSIIDLILNEGQQATNFLLSTQNK